MLVLSGCDGSPDPAPTTTAPLFATEAEAFAAAEATYRAYVDAGNARRGDATSTPAPEEFLVGKALSDELEGARQIAASGRHLEGSVHVTKFDGLATEAGRVHATACLDVRDTRVLDASGKDITPEGRAPIQGVNIVFQQVGTQLLIADSQTGESSSC